MKEGADRNMDLRWLRTMLRCVSSPRIPPLAQTASKASSPRALRRAEMGFVGERLIICGSNQHVTSELTLSGFRGFSTAPSKRLMAAS